MAEYLMDARGLICPLPVLKARKKLLSLKNGDALRVLIDSAESVADFKMFCAEQGYSCQVEESPQIAVIISV
jgi:tRNA 2-thiouridine synthesizing protein A